MSDLIPYSFLETNLWFSIRSWVKEFWFQYQKVKFQHQKNWTVFTKLFIVTQKRNRMTRSFSTRVTALPDLRPCGMSAYFLHSAFGLNFVTFYVFTSVFLIVVEFLTWTRGCPGCLLKNGGNQCNSATLSKTNHIIQRKQRIFHVSMFPCDTGRYDPWKQCNVMVYKKGRNRRQSPSGQGIEHWHQIQYRFLFDIAQIVGTH